MEEAEYADRIAIIDHGRIVALDTPGGTQGRRSAPTRSSCTPPTTPRPPRALERAGLVFEPRRGELVVSRRRRRGPGRRASSRSSGCRCAASTCIGRRSTTCSCISPAARSAQDSGPRPQPDGARVGRAPAVGGPVTTLDRPASRGPRRRRPRFAAQRGPHGGDGLATRVHPLLAHALADPVRVRPADPVPVRARVRHLAAGRYDRRVRLHEVRVPGHRRDERGHHRDLLGDVDRVGPRVRVPARDAGRAR